jgi:hypothetical protein
LGLEAIRRLLHWAVFERRGTREEPLITLRLFERTWADVQRRIGEASNALDGIKTPGSPEWRRLVDAGLTDDHLDMKIGVLTWLTSGRTASVKRLLDWANTFLGSLAPILPVLEAVKEWKDGVELVVTTPRSPRVDTHIFKDLL